MLLNGRFMPKYLGNQAERNDCNTLAFQREMRRRNASFCRQMPARWCNGPVPSLVRNRAFLWIKALTRNIWRSTVSQSASRNAAKTVGKKKKKGPNRSGPANDRRRGKEQERSGSSAHFHLPRQGLSEITLDVLPFHPINPSKQRHTWRNRTQHAIWCDGFRGKVGRVVSVCSWRAASLPL